MFKILLGAIKSKKENIWLIYQTVKTNQFYIKRKKDGLMIPFFTDECSLYHYNLNKTNIENLIDEKELINF